LFIAWLLVIWVVLLKMWVNLIATLVGVLLAFQLDRWWERRMSKKTYAEQLNSCKYDLGLLISTCTTISGQVSSGVAPVLEIDAPALRALLVSPLLQKYGPHGLIMALTTLSSVGITPVSNIVEQHRQLSVTGSALTTAQQLDIIPRVEKLKKLAKYVQELIEKELGRLGVAITETEEDKKALKDLSDILGS